MPYAHLVDTVHRHISENGGNHVKHDHVGGDTDHTHEDESQEIEQVGVEKVITAFLVYQMHDGTWAYNAEIAHPISMDRLPTFHDLIAASAVVGEEASQALFQGRQQAQAQHALQEMLARRAAMEQAAPPRG